MGYCKKGYSYNLTLKNIPYYIMAELKSIPLMPAHPRTHLYRKYTPPPRVIIVIIIPNPCQNVQANDENTYQTVLRGRVYRLFAIPSEYVYALINGKAPSFITLQQPLELRYFRKKKTRKQSGDYGPGEQHLDFHGRHMDMPSGFSDKPRIKSGSSVFDEHGTGLADQIPYGDFGFPEPSSRRGERRRSRFRCSVYPFYLPQVYLMN